MRMNAHDRHRLLAAAASARLEGWHAWEIPAIIRAEARALSVPCSLATARMIAAEVGGSPRIGTSCATGSA